MTPHPAVAASIWMLGALTSFMLMAVAGRELSSELSTFQILFCRSVIGLLILAAVLQHRGWHLARSGQPKLQLLRNLAHYGGQFGWFYALAILPMAEVFAIEFTVPIWTAILARLLLGEKLHGARLWALALGIAGMLVILRPGIAVISPAALVMLAGAVCYGLAHTLTRQLTRTDAPLTVLLWMTLVQLPLGAIPAWQQWVNPSPAMWPWLLIVGLMALSAHYCMTRALALADASLVVPMDFLRLPLIGLVGYWLYNEALAWPLLLGAGLMLAGNLLNIRSARRGR